MRASPSSGRYFPITPAELVAATMGWTLSSNVRRALKNPDRHQNTARVIASLRPGRDVVVFSQPLDVSPETGARLAHVSLQQLARWKHDAAAGEGESRAIVAYRQDASHIRLVEQRIKYSRGRFGAGEGLASSRKVRVTSDHITELGLVTI